jgi:hypothetical protein
MTVVNLSAQDYVRYGKYLDSAGNEALSQRPRMLRPPARRIARKREIRASFSVLDLAPIYRDSDAAHAFRNSLDLAQHAERWNYERYWLAEHHNMPGIASARDGSGDRLYRRRDQNHPRRIGRYHAAKPRAAGDRRAIRHAGIPL